MRSPIRRLAAHLPVILLVLAVPTASLAADRTATVDARALDAYLYESLRFVINHGVDLYNTSKIDGCNQHFRRTLEDLAPLLGHRPELKKVIATALAEVETNATWRIKMAAGVLDGGRPAVANAAFLPVDRQKSFALRAVLNEVREGLRAETKATPAVGSGEPAKTVRPDGRELIPVPPAEKKP